MQQAGPDVHRLVMRPDERRAAWRPQQHERQSPELWLIEPELGLRRAVELHDELLRRPRRSRSRKGHRRPWRPPAIKAMLIKRSRALRRARWSSTTGIVIDPHMSRSRTWKRLARISGLTSMGEDRCAMCGGAVGTWVVERRTADEIKMNPPASRPSI